MDLEARPVGRGRSRLPFRRSGREDDGCLFQWPSVPGGADVEVTFEQCSRAEAEDALRPIMGDQVGWYLDLMAEGVDAPQQANQLVEELTGSPAESVAQWAARNAELFR